MEEDKEIEDIVNELYDAPITHKISNKDSVRIKYAESYFQEITVSASNEDEFEESEVMDKDSVQYEAKETSDHNGEYVNENVEQSRRMSDPVSVVVKEITGNLSSDHHSFIVPIIENKNNAPLINTNQNDQFQESPEFSGPFEKQIPNDKKEKEATNLKDESSNNEKQKMNTLIVNKLEEIKQSNHNEIQKIYYFPTEINLPENIEENYHEVNTITPYIFTHPKTSITESNHHKQTNQIFDPQPQKEKTIENNSEHFEMAESFVEEESITDKIKDNQTVTDVLLEKINELTIKVKELENEKKLTSKNITNNKLTYSTSKSIQIEPNNRPNEQNQVLFSTTSSAQTKLCQKFKEEKQKFKIYSNIYSLKLNNNNNNNTIVDEINFLKQKLEFLEKKQFNNFERNTLEFDQVDNHDRKEFKGKIVRRRGSSGTPVDSTFYQNDFEAINEESIYSKEQIFENSKDDVYESKKLNIRKVPGSAIQRSRGFIKENESEFNTLEFNLSKEKLFVEESREFNFKNEENYPTEENEFENDIEIPELQYFPSSENSLEDLVEIGKITLEKFGCPCDSDTPFYVKKYKNCVHFKLNNFNILWHFDGKMYLGGWNPLPNGEGEKTGIGIEFIPGKYKFKGTFVEGKRCGFGKIIFENGTIYAGKWLNGLKHGKGKLRESNGLEYEGEWRDGKKNGEGTIRLKSRKEFEGIFKNNLKNGFGKESFENGDYYEGFYQNNKFHGKGKYIWKSTANYNGQFKEGKRHGHGIWRSLDQNYDEYEGNYYEDNKNGQGIYRWSNGAVYNGGFKNDQKHGEGTIMYPNGRVEKMTWVNGTVEKKNSLTNRSNQSREKSISNSKTNNNLNSKTERKNILSRESLNKISRTNSANINPNFERAIPKGISFRRFHQSDIDNQFKNKLKETDLLESRHENKSISDRREIENGPKDPPYKSMKTSSIINFNHT